ncbi:MULTISPECIES: hypothetical protein [unclassified Rhodanobacter]|uniref:hypothetical protein n=1 Tax=unclassified Rhodanobacter TaxID=2621553 RepID=UPI001BDEEFE3|nr:MULTISPECIES: hypothetical protein [unclassified Rhodanobacter]MBT2142966.1 hypothetical protein [Rhodanobacter sp. LX-99]MBT2147961.1 hypothetical protein [Rhodanobacter sp. LX-100]
MNWVIAGDAQLARYFEQENVWSKEWERAAGKYAAVLDHNDGELNLPIWEATFNGRRKCFAADEVSNSVWVFALPEP